jgi:chromate transporter
MQARGDAPDSGRAPGRSTEVFGVALLLGLTSFGGPIAHLGYFHREYVERRRWLSEQAYLDLVALCQLLPGPASSQVGIGIGLLRAGWPGAVAAWFGFTLPSAVLLTAFALLTADVDLAGIGWVHGLKLAAISIVAAAIVSMWRSFAPDWPRRLMAIMAAVGALALGSGALQVAVIIAGGLAGWFVLGRLPAPESDDAPSPVGRRGGIVAATALLALLVGLPLAAWMSGSSELAVVGSFARAGSLVFGGGHVVLPLLSESFVTPGWIDEDTFLAGYGAAQAVPGPLFTFAAHVGASLQVAPTGVAGAVVGIVAIFLPSFLLVAAAMPHWARLRGSASFRGVLAGASAAVIGLLLAALIDPLWTSTVAGAVDVALAAAGFAALVALRTPAWAVVAGLATAGQLAATVGLA